MVIVQRPPIDNDGIHLVKVKTDEGIIVLYTLIREPIAFKNRKKFCVVLVSAQVIRYVILVIDTVTNTIRPHMPLDIPGVILELFCFETLVAYCYVEITCRQIEKFVITEVVLHSVRAHGWIVLRLKINELGDCIDENDSEDEYSHHASRQSVNTGAAFDIENRQRFTERIKLL